MSYGQPPASFILLSYRQEATIAETVKSMLAQDCEPIEIIISDDASPDNTFAIIEKTVAGYSGPHTVTVRRNSENLGVNKHIETAISLAQSDLMIWTAGDDINTSNRVRTTLEAHRVSGAKLLYSEARTICGENGAGSDAYRSATLYKSHSLAEVATSFALYLGATAAWHKDLHRKYGGFPPERAHEDLILGFRASLEASLCYIPDKLVTYRENVGVSSELSGARSMQENGQRRRNILMGQLVVLHQRRADAKTFGLNDDSFVVRRIENLIQKLSIRLAYYDGFRAAYLRTPFKTVDALLSEWLRDKRKR